MSYKSTIFLLGFLISLTITGCESGLKGSGNNTIHNQGESCKSCHNFNGATVFNNLHAENKTKGVSGYHVQLGGADVYQTSSNGVGNSYYYGNATLSKFTAYVVDKNGNITNQSLANSHDNTRLDCNRCHTASGTNGAPGRIVAKP